MAQLLTVYRAENGFIVEIHNDGLQPQSPCPAPPVQKYDNKYKDVHVFEDADGLAEFMTKWGGE